MWARMALGATTREHDLKFLMAVRACDLLSDREIPFHTVAFVTVLRELCRIIRHLGSGMNRPNPLAFLRVREKLKAFVTGFDFCLC